MTNKTDVARLLEAASFAAFKHRDQRRRDVDATPYINHPLDVARILTEGGVEDVEVLMAGDTARYDRGHEDHARGAGLALLHVCM